MIPSSAPPTGVPDEDGHVYDLYEAQNGRPPWLRFFIGVPAPNPAPDHEHSEVDRAFVQTGPDTITSIVNAIHDGRNVMLVGPRGTGKSYMAKTAVDSIDAEHPKLGVVAVVTIQGDPNKPPSDYMEDAIVFRVEKPAGAPGRVLPDTIKAPLFQFARRDPKEPQFFEIDEHKNIILEKALPNGQVARIDRLVVFWDEGNRSSPAMQNAMLSLLAERVIRRDGKDYKFPPVSCVLTRNPDGYDAQSTKMPSPLIDRFAVQLYVYQPDLATFVNIIGRNLLLTFEQDLLQELQHALHHSLNQLASNPSFLPRDEATHLRVCLEQTRDAIKKQPDGKLLWHPGAAEKPIQALDMVDRLLEPATRPTENPSKELLVCYHAFKHTRDVLLRLLCKPVPDNDKLKVAVRLFALLVLATWGDARDPAEKPGMQYIPEEMRPLLMEMAKLNWRVRKALKRLGDRTRYGASIRAYSDLLHTLVGESIRNPGPTFKPVEVDLEIMRPHLGRLLNHRCEPSFNPDREPGKNREKTEALLDIAHAVLYTEQARCLALVEEALTELEKAKKRAKNSRRRTT